MVGRWLALLLGSVAICAAGLAWSQSRPEGGPPPPDFNVAIRPIFVSRCVSCHGPNLQRAGLRLDDRAAALKGSAAGPVIVPGNSGASKLFQMVASKRMPLDDELSVFELDALKAWIDAGARWPEKRGLQAVTVDFRVDAFRVAMRNNDRAAIARAVADPALVKARGKDGSTLLHHAAVYGDLAQVRALLDRGADVNSANFEGSTPLIWAVRDDDAASLLIARGADVNAVSEGGVTPLIAAAGRTTGANVVRMLLAQGARPTAAQQPQLATAAAIPGSLDILKLLFPAVLAANGPAGAAAATNATAARCYACLDYLLSKGTKGASLSGALVAAANSGDAALVKRLLDFGATLDGRGPQDAPALLAAAISDIEPAEKVRLLLAAGADVNARDAHGRTALTYALQIHPEIEPSLIAKGAK